MDRAFSQLLRLGALITVVARFLAVVAHNMREIFGAFWHLLVSWSRCGSVRIANGCSLTLNVGRLPATLRCMALLYLFDSVVVYLSTSFGLVVQDIIVPVALSALGFLGLEGLQFHRKLLELVPDVKRPLLFENHLLYCQIKCEEESIGPSGLRVRRHLLLEHIDLVD